MSGKATSWLVVFAVGTLTSASLAGPVLLGATRDGLVYEIDPTTGQTSAQNQTGLGAFDRGVTGLAFSPDGALFAGVSFFGRSGGQVFSVNPGTFESNLVLTGAGLLDNDFEFNVLTGTLLGVSSYGGSLVSADTITGDIETRPSELGSSGPLASDAFGRAYAVLPETDMIAEIDPFTGAVLSEWLIGFDLFSASGTTFIDDKLMILGRSTSMETTLWEFDPASGAIRTVGSIVTDTPIRSLAYIPEPATWALLLVGSFVLFFRRNIRGFGVTGGLALVLFSCVAAPSFAQLSLGGTAGQQTELGSASTLVYASRLHGDFVASGQSTRAARWPRSRRFHLTACRKCSTATATAAGSTKISCLHCCRSVGGTAADKRTCARASTLPP